MAADRIDGANFPGGFMKGYVNEKIEDLIFWDTLYLQNFLSTTQSKPGFHFDTSLKAFWEKHFVLGEKFLEYVCGACSTDDKPYCEF